MADERKTPDEYQYPPDEYYKGGEYPSEDIHEHLEPEEAPRRSSFSRRLLLGIGFLAAIALVYLILSYRIAQRSAELAQPTPQPGVATIPSTSNAQMANLNNQPVTPPVQVEAPSNSADIQRLTMQNQANQQTIASLQTQMQQLQSQLSSITSTLSTLNNQMQVIVNEIRGISLERATRGKDLRLPTGTEYHLKGLVPGRAWIQARNGFLTSVTLGDQLPGYGIVQMISVDQGIITTSSGAVITYGPKDK